MEEIWGPRKTWGNLAQDKMLFGETSVGYGDAHREEVERNLPLGTVDYFTPMSFVAVGMVNNEEKSVGSGKWNMGSGMREAIVLFEAPEDIGGGTPATGAMRGQHLGVEPVDKRRMQAELRLRT